MMRVADPVPMYIEIYDRASTEKERVRFVEWQRHLPIAPAFFEPPPGVELERIDYASYRRRASRSSVGPAPPLFPDLLHGLPSEEGTIAFPGSR